MHICIEFLVFSLEKRALQLNDRASAYNLILAVATHNIPTLISNPRENFQFVFEGLAR